MSPAAPDCLVVGAGPAGLAAAIASARAGLSVVVLEKNDRPGRKLLLTGGGRCNLTDRVEPALGALEAFGRDGRSLRQVLSAFDLAGFLAGLGVEVEVDGGASYVKGGARRMLEALLEKCARLGVRIEAEAAARSARRTEAGGFEVETECGHFAASKHLVIATGGLTHPATGSTGDGYGLARAFGHEVGPAPVPALGALATSPAFPELAGVSVAEAELALFVGGGKRPVAKTRGALLLTHAGISGPAALDLSLELARFLGKPDRTDQSDQTDRSDPSDRISCSVDLAPSLSREELLAELIARARSETKRTLENSGLEGLPVPARLGVELARRAGLDPRRRMGAFSDRDFARLAAAAKCLELAVAAPARARDAMVTVGGVAMKQLDPKTLESRLVPGLRFAGEVLAPAGPCGGYNLLMAFATGDAAGK